MMAAVKMLLMASTITLAGCGTKLQVVFVREDVTVTGAPRSILKTVEPVEVDAAFYNGSEWVVAEDVVIPAGWLVVSPKVVKED